MGSNYESAWPRRAPSRVRLFPVGPLLGYHSTISPSVESKTKSCTFYI